MLSRRSVVLGFAASCAAVFSAGAAQAFELPGVEPVVARTSSARKPKPVSTAKASNKIKKKSRKSTHKPFVIDPMFEPQDVEFYSLFAPGTIVVNSEQRLLYLVQAGNRARRYGVAIGSDGLGWKGIAKIKSKVEWPGWRPTAEMIKRSPEKYLRYKDGMPGGPENPLGARAMYFYQGKRDTMIRIHGTTQPWTIGQAASNGCFRMVNEHIIDLYERVKWGAPVIVI
jgi:lipoprotein-anchoring transpeptidase ErfK/SrfK